MRTRVRQKKGFGAAPSYGKDSFRKASSFGGASQSNSDFGRKGGKGHGSRYNTNKKKASF